MKEADWSRCDDPDLASERILAGAEQAFVELGVHKASMAKVAEYAGCSRVTLYRYFENRHALHVAYIDRVAGEIISRVREQTRAIDDPREQLVEAILCSVAEVRRRPGAAAWFEPTMAGVAARMSRSSEVIALVAGSFFDGLFARDGEAAADDLTRKWIFRVIVSLLSVPEEREGDERLLVERFVAPALVGAASR